MRYTSVLGGIAEGLADGILAKESEEGTETTIFDQLSFLCLPQDTTSVVYYVSYLIYLANVPLSDFLSTSTNVQHLPDANPTMGPYDSVVEATLHQLHIRTKHEDNEPLCVPAAPVRHVNGLLPAPKPPPLHLNYAY